MGRPVLPSVDEQTTNVGDRDVDANRNNYVHPSMPEGQRDVPSPTVCVDDRGAAE